MKESPEIKAELSTEDSIKEAAKIVFLKKGFAGTKTRDIAEQAGENLALINYYFRSKKNLFQIVMNEILMEFLESSIPVFNDPNTSIQEKIEVFVDKQLDLFMQQPEIPLFVVNEITDSQGCFTEFNKTKHEKLLDSVFHQQLEQQYGGQGIDPEHIMLNIVGMTIYPFLGRSMMNGMQGVCDDGFDKLIEERKKLIPVWTMAMLNNPQK